MLRFLQIRDFAIVDSLDLEVNAGFTCITGETGAGKSILVGALGLLSGERADTARAELQKNDGKEQGGERDQQAHGGGGVLRCRAHHGEAASRRCRRRRSRLHAIIPRAGSR